MKHNKHLYNYEKHPTSIDDGGMCAAVDGNASQAAH